MNPAQVNPLAAITSANQAAQAEFETRAWQAKQAAGQAFQSSIDPATGRPRQTVLLQNLARDPNAALAAQPSAQAGQTLDEGTRSTHLAKLTGMNAAMIALTAQYPNGVPPDVWNAEIDRVGPTFGVSPEDIAQAHASVSPDPVQNSRTIIRNSISNQTAQDALHVAGGGTGTQTGPNGATIGFKQNSGVFGGGITTQPQQGAPQGQSPADLNKLVKIGTNPDGSDRMGTQRQAQNLAEGRDANDDGPNAGPLGTGRPVPPALLNPNKPAPAASSSTPPAPPLAPVAAPATTAQPPTPAPGFTVGQPTAQRTAQETTGTTSANQFQNIVDQGVKARSQDALLGTMLSEAQGFRPGPGADLASTIKRTILGAGAQFGTTFGIDTDKLAKQESVTKIGNQLADAQGAGSDARMRVNEGANPSVHNTPAGLDLIIRQLRGNTDYLRARQQLAAAYPEKDKIDKFEADIASNLDPRVFQYQRMQTGQQRTDYFNGLEAADKPKFKKAYDWATQYGLLTGG
jgi:hypothetical protein